MIIGLRPVLECAVVIFWLYFFALLGNCVVAGGISERDDALGHDSGRFAKSSRFVGS